MLFLVPEASEQFAQTLPKSVGQCIVDLEVMKRIVVLASSDHSRAIPLSIIGHLYYRLVKMSGCDTHAARVLIRVYEREHPDLKVTCEICRCGTCVKCMVRSDPFVLGEMPKVAYDVDCLVHEMLCLDRIKPIDMQAVQEEMFQESLDADSNDGMDAEDQDGPAQESEIDCLDEFDLPAWILEEPSARNEECTPICKDDDCGQESSPVIVANELMPVVYEMAEMEFGGVDFGQEISFVKSDRVRRFLNCDGVYVPECQNRTLLLMEQFGCYTGGGVLLLPKGQWCDRDMTERQLPTLSRTLELESFRRYATIVAGIT